MVQQGAGMRATLSLLIAVGLLFGLVGIAEAKPARPDTLTLKYKVEELPPLVERPPSFGRSYYGKLTSTRPACQRDRPVFARYEFPDEPPGTEPLIRPMWGGGEGTIKTDARGFWRAEPVLFAGMSLRVTAFVKTKPAGAKPCPMVESRTLTLPPQMPAGE